MKKAIIFAIGFFFCATLQGIDRERFRFKLALTETEYSHKAIYKSGWTQKKQNGNGILAGLDLALTDSTSSGINVNYNRLSKPQHIWSAGKIDLGPHRMTATLIEPYISHDLFGWLEVVADFPLFQFKRLMPVIGSADRIEQTDTAFHLGGGLNYQQKLPFRFAVRGRIRIYPIQFRQVSQKSTQRIPPPLPTPIAETGRDKFTTRDLSWSFGVDLVYRIQSKLDAFVGLQRYLFKTPHADFREVSRYSALAIGAAYRFDLPF